MAYTMDCPAALVTVAVATPVQLEGIQHISADRGDKV